MQKTIRVSLNKFPVIPHSLRVAHKSNEPVHEVAVDLARLYHHYYLDTRGFALPKPDPAQFEHLTLLLPCTDFRARGDGFGVGTAFRQHRSNELGQAFCRWFLYEHLNITYFAHMSDVLNRAVHAGFGGLKIERITAGDTPDYFCAENTSNVFLSEAKGRRGWISFANADFKKWRKQFDRVIVKEKSGAPRSVKGFIVATRFATEDDGATVKSTLFAEDPTSPGDEPLRETPELGSLILALHYSDIAAKIRQPILSSALATGYTVPEEIQFPAAVWEFRAPPLQGKRFVGGYFPAGTGVAPIEVGKGQAVFLASQPWRLDVGSGTFFGVEEGIFRGLCAMARVGDRLAAQVNQFPDVQPFFSGISLLRDGSIIGPIDFFNPIGLNVY
jgi:hypothetical protein